MPEELKRRAPAISVIVHQYRYFYYLANEIAHHSWCDRHDNNAFRYATGAVILSYTCVETYFNQLFFSDEYALYKLHDGMSAELGRRVERMSLPEKIEFAIRFYPKARGDFFKKGEEPYQSFNLLRQLRNFLVHYVPERELVWSGDGEHIDQIKSLEKRVSGRFPFMTPSEIRPGDGTKAFAYRIFNKHCARWAFESIDPTLDAVSSVFDVARVKLEQYWKIEDPESG